MKDKITVPKAREFVLSAEPGKRLWDTEIEGFHLRLLESGKASWYLQYRSAESAKKRTLKLGGFPAMTVPQARERAKTEAAKVRLGGDPRADLVRRKADEKRLSKATARAYLEGPYELYLRNRKGGDITRSLIRNHFHDWLNRLMTSLRPDDLSVWQLNRQQEDRSWGTIQRAWDAMRAMLNHAVKKGYIESNPLSGHTLEKPANSGLDVSRSTTTRRYLEPAEVEALFVGLDAYQEKRREERRRSRAHGKPYLSDLDNLTYVDHVVPWLKMMFYTGFRPGDLFGLRWENIDFNFRNIRKVIEKTAHHNDRPRTFPLSKAALEVLEQWHVQCGRPARGYVFTSERTGSRMDKGAMQRPWRTIRKLGGLDQDLHLYTLRHHFASKLVMMGVDLLTVSRLMAHADIQTTIEHYGHLQQDRARDVVDFFAAEAERSVPVNPDVIPELQAGSNKFFGTEECL